MPLLSEFDAERIRLVLDDLERTTRGKGGPPLVRLQPATRAEDKEFGVVVEGTATRIGGVRLGIRIARRALDCDALILIDEENLPGSDIKSEIEDIGFIKIYLIDDPLPVPPAHARDQGRQDIFAALACGTVFFLSLGTFLVGLVTIIVFLARLVNRWVSG